MQLCILFYRFSFGYAILQCTFFFFKFSRIWNRMNDVQKYFIIPFIGLDHAAELYRFFNLKNLFSSGSQIIFHHTWFFDLIYLFIYSFSWHFVKRLKWPSLIHFDWFSFSTNWFFQSVWNFLRSSNRLMHKITVHEWWNCWEKKLFLENVCF